MTVFQSRWKGWKPNSKGQSSVSFVSSHISHISENKGPKESTSSLSGERSDHKKQNTPEIGTDKTDKRELASEIPALPSSKMDWPPWDSDLVV